MLPNAWDCEEHSKARFGPTHRLGFGPLAPLGPLRFSGFGPFTATY